MGPPVPTGAPALTHASSTSRRFRLSPSAVKGFAMKAMPDDVVEIQQAGLAHLFSTEGQELVRQPFGPVARRPYRRQMVAHEIGRWQVLDHEVRAVAGDREQVVEMECPLHSCWTVMLRPKCEPMMKQV